MSSREIAKLTDKEHKHVLADIRTMLEQLGLTSAEFSANLPDAYGRPQPAFALPKDLTITLVAGYSAPLRHRIVTRWMELESQQARPVAPALPNFTDPAEAAIAWAQQFKLRQAAEARALQFLHPPHQAAFLPLDSLGGHHTQRAGRNKAPTRPLDGLRRGLAVP
jgi:phage regulator Rha-like protein